MDDTRSDGWGNMLTGVGFPGQDKRLASEIRVPDRLSQQQLEDLYTGDPLARRICDLPANEQTRKWIEVSADEEIGKHVLQSLQVLGVQDKVTEALTWARLYGGAVLVLGVDDGRDPARPLNENAIRSLSWMNVLHRWELERGRKYSDAFASKYGETATYKVNSSIYGPDGQPYGREIHESRIICFDGVRTPRQRRERNDGWCDSIFTALAHVLRDFWGGFDGASALIQDFGQAVYKMRGLADLVASSRSHPRLLGDNHGGPFSAIIATPSLPLICLSSPPSPTDSCMASSCSTTLDGEFCTPT